MKPMINSQCATGWILAVLLTNLLFPVTSLAQANEESRVAAPKGTVKLSSQLDGSFFVDAQLLNKYNALKARLTELRKEIDAGKSTSESALSQLEQIETESTALRAEIEATKTFVAAFKVYRKQTESTYTLADSQNIIVVGDNVRIRGWQGPGIKCELEKMVLANTQPDEDEFEAIKIDHEVKILSDVVGKTTQERTADELEFRNSAAGQKMSEEQLRSRESFWRKQFSGYNVFSDFQGVPANVLSVTGLTHEQGNRQLTARISSEGGGTTMGSQWRRHVSVTIFVPPCQHVMVAGCMVKLDIEDVNANLLLTTSQSRNRDYEGSFEVRNIHGNVTIDQAPVRLLDGIKGNIVLGATNEFVNSGTFHSGGFRTAYSYETQPTEIRHVSGNLTAHFLRTQLSLAEIGGVIDVTNEYGNTELKLTKNAKMESAMRIISESGEVQVSGPSDLLQSIPIHAHTLCGKLYTDLDRETLDDVSFAPGSINPQRGWSGFVTPAKERFSFEKFERPEEALENAERSPGLDLISKAGRVSILTESSE